MSSGSTNSASGAANLVYQNVNDIRPLEEGKVLSANLLLIIIITTCYVGLFFDLNFQHQNYNVIVIEFVELKQIFYVASVQMLVSSHDFIGNAR